ncbi:DUF4861 family protein [Bowmanella sp. Y26]|uniref:DUF4861 family protein n=1 Tax=Bowmanella yangjiangensis TaxID=2811230 RepID=UPI001BDC6DF6|nr:DUF4861 family protein [Bowmanella yangjiangensis]MBT1063373.1 DUF4861 family protein [Bowmanella yangjiangensis]
MKQTFSRDLHAPLLLIGVTALLAGCQNSQPPQQDKIELTATNPLPVERPDGQIALSVDFLTEKLGLAQPKQWVLINNGQTLPQQWIDTDADGQVDQLLALADFSANESKHLTLSQGKVKMVLSKRVNAELAKKYGADKQDGIYQGGDFVSTRKTIVPEDHTVGDLLYKFEGLGWESEYVGYRLYLDQRNTTDIFGKKRPEMVLEEVGQPGTNYHQLNDWGMDVLKVGPSLGIGGIGFYHDGQVKRVDSARVIDASIVQDGPLYANSQVRHLGATYQQQPFHQTSRYGIYAGSRLTWHDASADGAPVEFVTGLVKHPNTEKLVSADAQNSWAYLASFGTQQSEAKDALGMAVFYQTADVLTVMEDSHNYFVRFKPNLQRVSYGFAAVWQQDVSGISSKAEYRQWLDGQLQRLNHPIQISLPE